MLHSMEEWNEEDFIVCKIQLHKLTFPSVLVGDDPNTALWVNVFSRAATTELQLQEGHQAQALAQSKGRHH